MEKRIKKIGLLDFLFLPAINATVFSMQTALIQMHDNLNETNIQNPHFQFSKRSNSQTEPYFFKIFYLQQSETTKVNLHRKWLRTAMLVDFLRFNYIFTFNSTFLPQFSNSAFFLSILLPI